MIHRSRHIVYLFTFLFFGLTNVKAQCTYEFKVYSKTELNTGTIEVQVNANSTFEVELFIYNGIEKKLLEKRVGSGNEKIYFKELSTNSNTSYRVAVIVPSENDFLCKKRMSDDIFFDVN